MDTVIRQKCGRNSNYVERNSRKHDVRLFIASTQVEKH